MAITIGNGKDRIERCEFYDAKRYRIFRGIVLVIMLEITACSFGEMGAIVAKQ
jgi:hypothetical protein